MAVYSWILLIAAAIYGSLSAYGGFADIKDKKTSLPGNIFMIIGGFIIIIAVIPEVIQKYQLMLLISGLIMVHIAVLLNEIKLYGKIIVKHHAIKLLLSLMLIILYFIK